MTSFKDLSLQPPLLRAVGQAGYKQPSPIQEKAIPPVLEGRDLLACAQTGTGKTAAFALPMLQRLASLPTPQAKRPIRALVLTPTRELALQIFESFESYGRHLPLRAAVIFGGVGQAPQVAQLRRGIDILVATPGRLNDLIGQGYIKLQQLQIFVLDEADRMLDMGFVNDVKKVIAQLPPKRQTLLFSATMPPEIVQLANGLLHQPERVFVTPPSTTVEKIEQCVYFVEKADKRRLLAHLLQDAGIASALVFTRTKHGADRVARDLKRSDIAALAIHGDKTQGARQQALSRFKTGQARVLVATDIAARGLDISELSHVINYDLPNIPETYVHRIGRTGRAGKAGIAISFCAEDEIPYLADIEQLIGFAVPRVENHPWAMTPPPEKPAAQKQGKKAAKTPAAKPRGEKPAPPPKQAKPPAKAGPASGAKPPAPAAQKQGRPVKNEPTKTRAKAPGKNPPRRSDNPYENRTGGHAIVTKRPPWSDAPGPDAAEEQSQGGDDMSRNNSRGRRRKRGPQAQQGENNKAGQAQQPPPIRKNEHGVFDFSEEELAQDTSMRLISGKPANGEAKYSSFEDYLKDH